MTWISDDAVARLRDVTEQPDLGGTRYRLVRELGRGGMGVVYEAYDSELDRAVALKVLSVILSEAKDPLPARGSLAPPGMTRLAREARIVARLEHPGIVPVHDVGTLADGRIYYTMKLVRGVDLRAWAGGGRSRTDALRLFTRICEAVAFAHANGVVHRDLKPENVMVGEFGAVLVMDWGVAHAADDAVTERAIVGTPRYMAPEQARGEPADARSDVYALGAMLSFLVRATSESTPRPLAAIVARAMAGDPAQRYADARQLGADVLRFLDDEPVSAYRENPLERAGRWLARNRVLVVLVAAYLVMRAIVFFWMRL
ncbi:MAG TPA: serine/threonine-protein kinase [Thermoanaerobaculia bacterium]|nr:serine/threonine-protein kinase [Thermoanaerobaculia bacterium]